MAYDHLCECGRDTQPCWKFVCDICKDETTGRQPDAPPIAAYVTLSGRWQLHLCVRCFAAIVMRAPTDERRYELVKESGIATERPSIWELVGLTAEQRRQFWLEAERSG